MLVPHRVGYYEQSLYVGVFISLSCARLERSNDDNCIGYKLTSFQSPLTQCNGAVFDSTVTITLSSLPDLVILNPIVRLPDLRVLTFVGFGFVEAVEEVRIVISLAFLST